VDSEQKKPGLGGSNFNRFLQVLINESGCEPSVEYVRKISYNITGIDPRHRLIYLSLLPSGPDEVRNSLLRGDRSE